MQSLREILAEILQRHTSNSDFCLELLRVLWPQIVGPRLARHSNPLHLGRESLTVAVATATWQNELQKLSGLLEGCIAQWLGRGRIQRLIFEVADISPAPEIARNVETSQSCNSNEGSITEAQIDELLNNAPESPAKTALAAALRAYPRSI